ncbi:MAG: D-tyrosyl-tRNA(Tyr) deacylase [Sphingobacteriia bacterium]|nr:MAG: D-tyrosyl-tRNA(Tyr) deacylase [Sphingobacteriia bacterium]
MRVVIQRVLSASVVVAGQTVGAIGPGLLVLAGFVAQDQATDLEWMSKKITQLRIFDDAAGTMNCSVLDTQGSLLVVSQFTLHALTQKGNRPSYVRAAKPEQAVLLYEAFKMQLEKDLGRSIASGQFGADMQVSLVNNGPVTIIMDTENRTI